jgi:uncharacterized membrane protein
MFEFSPVGTVHTIISVVAVLTGLLSLIRYGRISLVKIPGMAYVYATAMTCLTGFAIFEHGTFGKPHLLGLLTLVVLGIGIAARWMKVFGRNWLYVEAVAYSTTFFFHTIPGMTETFTRLPHGSPIFTSAKDPALAKAVFFVFLVFIIGFMRGTMHGNAMVCRPVQRNSRRLAPGTLSTTSPISAAASNPWRWNSAITSPIALASQLTSRPPLVCGSVSSAWSIAEKLSGSDTSAW